MAKDQFSLDVSKFIKGFEDGAGAVMRITAEEVFSQITYDSPVDEGRFRGAWTATGAKPSTKIGGIDADGSATVLRMRGVIKNLKDWSIFTYTNNMPQSLLIEYGLYPNPPKRGTWNKEKGAYEINTINGYSKQARKGLVRYNIERVNKVFETDAKRLLPK
jgi:hypothetical protein